MCRPLPLARTCTRTASSRMSDSSMQQGHVLLKQQRPRHISGTGWQTSAICRAAPCTRHSRALVEKILHLTLTQGLQTAACSGQDPSSSSNSRQAVGSNAGCNRRSLFCQVRGISNFCELGFPTTDIRAAASCACMPYCFAPLHSAATVHGCMQLSCSCSQERMQHFLATDAHMHWELNWV
jgi:hypothetical protein